MTAPDADRLPPAVVTQASAGTGTYEVLQVVLHDWHAVDTAVAVVTRDYVERHGHQPDGTTVLATIPVYGGTETTVLVYDRRRGGHL